MQHEDGAKARAGWVAALAPALKVKPGAFGFMADGGVDASLHQEWRSSGDGNGGTVQFCQSERILAKVVY